MATNRNSAPTETGRTNCKKFDNFVKMKNAMSINFKFPMAEAWNVEISNKHLKVFTWDLQICSSFSQLQEPP